MKRAIKPLLSFVIVSVAILCSFSVKAQQAEDYELSYPANFSTAVLADLKMLLEKATGKSWVTIKDREVTRGIKLIISETGNFKTGESCLINSNGKDLIQFQALTNKGLAFGVYRYLRDLGFKFYLPDELYTIIPSTVNIFSNYNQTVTPFLRIRDFFGTGGLGSGLTDPDLSVEKDWELWKLRNGLGSEFVLDGHAGEAFNLDNATVLEKNSSWTATPIKKGGQVDEATKLNYFNPDAITFFADWVIRKFTDKNYKLPPPNVRDMVSIEPADGGGYKTGSATIDGIELNTVSDQVFFAANKAAQKLDKLFPDHPQIGINLYAYSHHADVPSFKLHPRVFVQIIPYQFQNIAFGPIFIKRWSEKVKRFGLYDYYKYADNYMDLPGGYTLDQLMIRALHAARAGSEGTSYESSYSKFATGIQIWVLSRFMADSDTQWNSQYNNLITSLYGKSAAPVKKIFDLFYRQVQFGAAELKTSFTLLSNAESLNKDAVVAKRLEELRLYLIYVRLQHSSLNLKNGNLEQRTLPVFKMAWTLYEKKIVHSYRIMQLVSYGFLNTPGTDAAMQQRHQQLHLLTFPETNDANAYWKQNKSSSIYSEKELEAFIETALKELPDEAVVQDKKDLHEIISKEELSLNTVKTTSFQSNSLHRASFNFYSAKPVTITINWTMTNAESKKPEATISGINKSYTKLYDQQIEGQKGTFSLDLSAGESSFFVNASTATTYKFDVSLNGAYIYFSPTPRISIAFFDDNKTPTYQPPYFPCYFYVPEGTQFVKYKIQGNTLAIYPPGEAAIKTELIETLSDDFSIRSFKVSPSEQGKFWKAVVAGNFNYELVSIPDQWFILQPK